MRSSGTSKSRSAECGARSVDSVPPIGWNATSYTIVGFVDTKFLLSRISNDPGDEDYDGVRVENPFR